MTGTRIQANHRIRNDGEEKWHSYEYGRLGDSFAQEIDIGPVHTVSMLPQKDRQLRAKYLRGKNNITYRSANRRQQILH